MSRNEVNCTMLEFESFKFKMCRTIPRALSVKGEVGRTRLLNYGRAKNKGKATRVRRLRTGQL